MYEEVESIADFVQMEPHEGVPATERTDVWIFFDDDSMYVSARCWDSAPERMIANEMRRDATSVYQNETFSFMFDTFHDGRNAVVFIVNPIWDVAFDRFEGDWTVAAAVPFRSLRYRPDDAQVWGFLSRRVVKGKNEASFLPPVSALVTHPQGILQASLAATLVGVEVPAGSRNLEVKPYVISDLTTNRSAIPPIANNLRVDVGGGSEVRRLTEPDGRPDGQYRLRSSGSGRAVSQFDPVQSVLPGEA